VVAELAAELWWRWRCGGALRWWRCGRAGRRADLVAAELVVPAVPALARGRGAQLAAVARVVGPAEVALVVVVAELGVLAVVALVGRRTWRTIPHRGYTGGRSPTGVTQETTGTKARCAG
jgi:hypothetical protein